MFFKLAPDPISSGPEDLELLFDLFLDLCKQPQVAPVRQLAVERLVPSASTGNQQLQRPKKVRL
jgi:hypothetical protein